MDDLGVDCAWEILDSRGQLVVAPSFAKCGAALLGVLVGIG